MWEYTWRHYIEDISTRIFYRVLLFSNAKEGWNYLLEQADGGPQNVCSATKLIALKKHTIQKAEPWSNIQNIRPRPNAWNLKILAIRIQKTHMTHPVSCLYSQDSNHNICSLYIRQFPTVRSNYATAKVVEDTVIFVVSLKDLQYIHMNRHSIDFSVRFFSHWKRITR